MVRIELLVDLSYEIDERGADFVFDIHVARTPRQSVCAERLVLSQSAPARIHTDPVTGNRYMRLRALPGALKLSCAATVDPAHHRADPAPLVGAPVGHFPSEVIGDIYPSRYCRSGRLLRLAANEFGNLCQGYGRVQAIRDWVHRRVAFTPNGSNSNTSARRPPEIVGRSVRRVRPDRAGQLCARPCVR